MDFVLDILASSTSYYYCALYLYHVRDFADKFDSEEFRSRLKCCKIGRIQQLYDPPQLSAIRNFTVTSIAGISESDLLIQRQVRVDILNRIKESTISSEEMITKISNSNYDIFKMFPHDLVLLDFPSYCYLFSETNKTIMNCEAILAANVRFYLAIMACSIVKSYYYLKLLEFLFLDSDGEVIWLIEGLKATPPKIQALSCLLNKLANSCWTITYDDLCYLKRSGYWSIKELVQSAFICFNNLRISSITESLGFSALSYDSKALRFKEGNESMQIQIVNDNENINKSKLKTLRERLEELNEIKEIKEEKQSKETYLDEGFVHKRIKLVNEETSLRPTSNTGEADIFSKFIDTTNKKYVDFDSRVFDYESYLDFNWSDQAYFILKDILDHVADAVNKDSSQAFEMTTNTLGYHKDVNTKQIRLAIWCYIEKIFGLEREDYNYSIVNKLLGREEKTFIKSVACYPEYITCDVLEKLPFNSNEIVHIAILATTAKMQTQFTFFTSKLYELMNND